MVTEICLGNLEGTLYTQDFIFYSREQGTGNREQGTGNREQGTGNREQGTGNREQETGNRGQSPSVYGFWLNSLSHSSAYRYIILGEYLFIYKIYFYTQKYPIKNLLKFLYQEL
ncbi:MAG: hypothetical protein ACK6A9_13665 [Dolichospermum sp.]